ncbi:unnamed protein product, partial [Musa acuminata subsp. burmannicoides]
LRETTTNDGDDVLSTLPVLLSGDDVFLSVGEWRHLPSARGFRAISGGLLFGHLGALGRSLATQVFWHLGTN